MFDWIRTLKTKLTFNRWLIDPAIWIESVRSVARPGNTKSADLRREGTAAHLQQPDSDELAAAGFGASLLPIGILAGEIASGTLREIRTRRPVRPHMFYLARRPLDNPPHLRLVEEVAREILQKAGELAR